MDRMCHDCQYWDGDGSPQPHQGTCHRYAPQPVAGEPQRTEISWPITYESDWCGEFTPKDAANTGLGVP